jgi:hypothetical protein
MAAHTGKAGMGLYKNGCGELGDDTNFTFTNWYTGDSFSGDGCFAIDFDTTSGWQSNEFIPVDTSKYYYHSVTARTLQRSGTSNRLAGGHMGFACYDKNKNFIDLRNCGDVGNTTLSRPANPGDSVIYVTSASGWYTGADVTNNRGYHRLVLFFPANHPDYGAPWEYTRLNNRSYYRLEQTSQGDWAMYLSSYRGSGTGIQNPSSLPDYGVGTMPAGTPISRGSAGGSYNYCHGSPNLPETWTTYTTGAFRGENRNSSTPFRYGTKYIKFLNLANYNNRSDSGRPRPKFLLDNIMLVQAKPVKNNPNTYNSVKSNFFKKEKVKWLKGKTRLRNFWKTFRST